MPELVDAMPDDEPFLLALYSSTRKDEVSAWGWEVPQLDAFLHMQYQFQQRSYRAQYPEARLQLIVHDTKRIGKLLVAHANHAIVLVDIALLPEHQNEGYGTELVLSLQREAVEYGKPLLLHVQTTNRAKRLYERLGFQETSSDSMYCEMQWIPASRPHVN